jgi:septum formation protein
MKIILGSQSKSRRVLLGEMGYDFEVMPSHIDEKAIRFVDPYELTLALARAKGAAVAEKINEPAIIITADQVVVCNGEIWEKPENADEARRFLKTYNSCPAQTVNAVVVTNSATKRIAQANNSAKIYFFPFSDDEIDKLIAVGDVFRLAGGFNVSGDIWEEHVKNIEGDWDSVMGLPKKLTEKLINEILK